MLNTIRRAALWLCAIGALFAARVYAYYLSLGIDEEVSVRLLATYCRAGARTAV